MWLNIKWIHSCLYLDVIWKDFWFQREVWYGKRRSFCYLTMFTMCSYQPQFQMLHSLLSGSVIFTSRYTGNIFSACISLSLCLDLYGYIFLKTNIIFYLLHGNFLSISRCFDNNQFSTPFLNSLGRFFFYLWCM